MNGKKNYTTVADLLIDDSFLAWYIKKDDRHQQVWNKWITQNPAHAALVKRAIQVLSVIMSPDAGMSPDEESMPDDQFECLLKKIADRENSIHKLI